jgi:hypothetical protein
VAAGWRGGWIPRSALAFSSRCYRRQAGQAAVALVARPPPGPAKPRAQTTTSPPPLPLWLPRQILIHNVASETQLLNKTWIPIVFSLVLGLFDAGLQHSCGNSIGVDYVIARFPSVTFLSLPTVYGGAPADLSLILVFVSRGSAVLVTAAAKASDN